MKIGVTSQNKLKLDAVINAYSFMSEKPEIIGYSAESDVGEQPINYQTVLGARNRINDVEKKATGLDRIISIENGIFEEDGKWLDKAIVVIYDVGSEKEYIAISDSVVFPDEYVEKARKLGFDTTTVGEVMENEGYILNKKDPHKCISGISRQVYLETTVQKLVKEVETK